MKSRIDYERTWKIPYGLRDFRLDRMCELLARLGNPQDALKIVHVAGTKGKGSTAAMIASVLSAAGYRTGLYSSPHLDRVEERLAIDGQSCPTAELAELIGRVQGVVEAMDAESRDDSPEATGPTYFEIMTALALVRFASRRVDAAVLEVGMGGRLDSTNVCRPLVSVITSISFDHTEQLGNTLAAIAGEKAGIIKPRTPVISGVVGDEPREVVAAVARTNGSRLVQLGADFDFTYAPPRQLERARSSGTMNYCCRAGGAPFELADLQLSLVGEHQAANAAVALATLGQLELQGWTIPTAAVRRGLANVSWPARVEVIRRCPAVVLDAAHNVASIEALARVLDESFSCSRRLLVFATTRDKDIPGMLQVLLPKFDEVIFTRYRNNPRGVPAEDLDAIAEAISPVTRHVASDAAIAWRLARDLAGGEDLICITGSFFIAAELRAVVRAQELETA